MKGLKGNTMFLRAKPLKTSCVHLYMNIDKEKLNNILIELSCPICYEYDNDMLLNQCAHNFCNKCVNGIDKCPICRSDLQYTNSVTINNIKSLIVSYMNKFNMKTLMNKLKTSEKMAIDYINKFDKISPNVLIQAMPTNIYKLLVSKMDYSAIALYHAPENMYKLLYYDYKQFNNDIEKMELMEYDYLTIENNVLFLLKHNIVVQNIYLFVNSYRVINQIAWRKTFDYSFVYCNTENPLIKNMLKCKCYIPKFDFSKYTKFMNCQLLSS